MDDVAPSNPNHSVDAPSRNCLRQIALRQSASSGRNGRGEVGGPRWALELLGSCRVQGTLRMLLRLPQWERPGQLYASLRKVGSVEISQIWNFQSAL